MRRYDTGNYVFQCHTDPEDDMIWIFAGGAFGEDENKDSFELCCHEYTYKQIKTALKTAKRIVTNEPDEEHSFTVLTVYDENNESTDFPVCGVRFENHDLILESSDVVSGPSIGTLINFIEALEKESDELFEQAQNPNGKNGRYYPVETVHAAMTNPAIQEMVKKERGFEDE